jgi:hypothetical protein
VLIRRERKEGGGGGGMDEWRGENEGKRYRGNEGARERENEKSGMGCLMRAHVNHGPRAGHASTVKVKIYKLRDSTRCRLL